jgi:predicted TIM-barrel fold metal-dependent hydrolase
MAGFRDYTLDKYLQKITDGGMTAVVYVQEKQGKQITPEKYLA